MAHIDAAMRNVIERTRTPESSIRVRGYGEPGRVLKIWFPLDDAQFIKSVAWEGEPDV